MNIFTLAINFSGDVRILEGQLQYANARSALKKACLAWGLAWGLGIFFLFVPYASLSVPFIFAPLGPAVGIAVYLLNRRNIAMIEAEALCPQCGHYFRIQEQDVRPPLYGHCPHCKTTYEVQVPENNNSE